MGSVDFAICSHRGGRLLVPRANPSCLSAADNFAHWELPGAGKLGIGPRRRLYRAGHAVGVLKDTPRFVSPQSAWPEGPNFISRCCPGSLKRILLLRMNDQFQIKCG